MDNAIFLDLSERAKFRITGTDRLRFLNGQITNDLRKASETSAIEACILNAKGKTDVQIEDVTDQFSLFHLLSKQPPAPEFGRIVSVHRFAEPGWDMWVEVAQHGALLQELSLRWTLLDSDAAEVMRIEQGIPRWGRELTAEIIPIEANLEQRTIDYQKGCYIGQEVISRIKMSGQTNKRLCGLISVDDIPLQPGMKLVAPSVRAKGVGWITSAARSETFGKEIALGYVKRGFNSAGTRLAVFATEDSEPTPVGAIAIEVVPLPFL